MALFLLAVAQAEGIDVSVTVDQIDSQNQPYDVNRTIVYSVHLSGANSSTSCSVLLEVGPDLHHSNLKNSYRDSVDLEPGKASTLYFPVDFRSSAFMGEEYQEWLLDLENATPWSLAWYRLEVISEDPTDRPVLVDDYSGWPEMIKVVQLSRDQSVTPAEGTRDDVYLYSASFFCTRKENISLQVAPSPQGPWTPLAERAYTAPGSWQTLEWEDVALNFDFETASYRFKGWEFSPAFEGPSRPILVQIQNSTVFPERALADQNFSFQVQLLATKEMEVSLVLLDPARNYTSSRGRLKYAKAPTWETLAWRDVSLLDMARFNGSTVYFFEFYTPDEEAPFATSRLLTGRYYQGPKLTLMEMGNATVAPGNGSLQTSFSYCIDLQAAVENSTLELQTMSSGSGNWTSRGTLPCNQSVHGLCWEEMAFGRETNPGGCRYRFLSDGHVLGEFPGPWIDLTFGNLYYRKIDQSDRYDYSVEVTASRPGLMIDLIYSDDGVEWWHADLVKKTGIKGYQIITWKEQPWHQAVAFIEVFDQPGP